MHRLVFTDTLPKHAAGPLRENVFAYKSEEWAQVALDCVRILRAGLSGQRWYAYVEWRR